MDVFGYPTCMPRVTKDKSAVLDTFLHYSDPTARQERSIFGEARKGLFYNYSDRLYGDEWTRGAKQADEAGHARKTGAWFEAALKGYHDAETLSLEHIIKGCNMSNGYGYLIFGYTYSSKKEQGE